MTIEGLHDRATVYVNGKYIGCAMRDRKSEPMIFDMPKEDARLDILVENMGRVNYGCAMLNEEKTLRICPHRNGL